MKNLFGFIDETGVLSNDPNQRFFALGILKLENTSSLFEDIKKLIVDILIGCIVYSYKIDHNLSATKNTPKGKLVSYIEEKLINAYESYNQSAGTFRHNNKLSGGFTIFKPFYFNVYEKK